MPKVSAAALSIVTPSVGTYAAPPAGLSTEAADVWRAVIRSKPMDWFGHDTYALLASYCRAVVEESRTGAKLHAMDVSTIESAEMKDYERLMRIVDTQRRTLTILSTKMRLCQQSKYGARQATEGRNRTQPSSSSSKPWEPKAATK